MRINIYIFFILVCNFCFSQIKPTTITGKVFIDSIPTEAAVVTIKSKTAEGSGITNQNGEFLFELTDLLTDEDSVLVKSSYFGYLPFSQVLRINNSKIINLNIYLEEDIQNLDEVVVTGRRKQISREVNKLSYSINKRDYLKNTKAPTILNSVPSLSYNKIKGVNIDGNKDAKIYIDGLEASLTELETIDVSDIEKIEVIYNPSARFGSEFTGGIINIISKENDKLFYKGLVEAGKGLLLNSTSLFPQITFKSNKLIFKGNFKLRTGEQEIDYSLNRNTDNGQQYSQKSFRIPTVTQKSGNVKVKYDLSENNIFFVNGSYNRNEVEGDFFGEFSVNSGDAINFSNDTGNSYEQFHVDAVYQKKIKRNSLFVKYKYLTYQRNDFFSIEQDFNTVSSLETQSKIDDHSGEISYEILGKEKSNLNAVFGSKYINRKFTFEGNFFYLNQQVISAFSDFSFSLSKKISFFSSLYLENTSNRNETLEQDFFNFLPTTSLNYKLNKKSGLEFSYNRRISRPNSYDLNENEIILNPGIIQRGNEDLVPQITSNYSLRYGKSIEQRDYLSITTDYKHINNAILQSISEDGDFLIYTKDNIGKVDNYGITLGFNTTIFKIFRSNINTGIRYSRFEGQEEDLNRGTSFYANLFLSTNLFKDRVSLSFFGSSNNPTYDFVSRTTTMPFTNLSIASNFFKDKLSVTLDYSDLFRLNSKTKTVIDNSELFQLININSNYSNISIIVSYNFGVFFNDRYKDNSIKNNDIKN